MSRIIGGFVLGAIFVFLTHHVDLSVSLEAIKNPFSSSATFPVSRELPTSDSKTKTTVFIDRVDVDYSEIEVKHDGTPRERVAILSNHNGRVTFVGLADGNYLLSFPNHNGQLCDTEWFKVKNGWVQDPRVFLGSCE